MQDDHNSDSELVQEFLNQDARNSNSQTELEQKDYSSDVLIILFAKNTVPLK